MKLFGLDISKAGKKEPETDIHSTIYAAVNDIAEILNLWDVSGDRKDIFDDLDLMVESDPEIAQCLDILLGDMIPIRDPYEPILKITDCTWDGGNDDKLREEIESIKKKAKLEHLLRTEITHKYLRYGNSYVEFCLYKDSSEFSKLMVIPQVWSVHRNVDKHGELKGGEPESKKIGECAYDQRSDSGQFLAGYKPYQMIHFRMAPYDKNGEGTPFLKALRRLWLRLQAAEDSMSIARLMRAFMKLVHHIPVPEGATPEQKRKFIEVYKRAQLKMRLRSINSTSGTVEDIMASKPTNVTTDYYSADSPTQKGGIDTIDPQNAQLQNISDVLYFHDQKCGRMKVPKARMGFEKDVNAKATLIEQFGAYAGEIVGFQLDQLIGCIDVFDRVLFLRGYDLDRLNYKIMLPSPFVKNELDRARIDHLDTGSGEKLIRNKILSRKRWLMDNYDLDEADAEAEAQQIVAEDALFPKTVGLFASDSHTSENILQELYKLKQKVEGNGSRNQLAFRR